MTPNGPFYRRLGLGLELLCMLGMIAVARGNTRPWSALGVDPSVVLTAGLAVGFLIWFYGTWLILKARKGPHVGD